ncbi:adenosylcobinamide amidohydrolase [Thermoplasmatales archaeon AK]|nr:adenosylcobinamide amidohydrolase [Thermoplasmatales archaeon AK]
MDTITNAPYRNGERCVRYINRTVPLSYDHDPDLEIADFLLRERLERSGTVLTLTAVDVTEAWFVDIDENTLLSITCGTENALSIGSDGKTSSGTINVFVGVNLKMRTQAALDLFQGIVETKCQILNDSGVRDKRTGLKAPGTSTDTVSIFFHADREGERFAGRLTKPGKKITVAVYDTLRQMLEK